MLAAGAREVYPLFRDAPIVRTRGDLAALSDRFTSTAASVMTVHLCSTVPMGEIAASPRPTVTDECTGPTMCT